MKIIGVSLRNFKCYEATQFVPLFFNNQKFTGFIGENGVGKSAVLEALYSFFTNQNWIRNKTAKKGEGKSLVAPILTCSEEDLKNFNSSEIRDIKKYSNTIKKNLLKVLNINYDSDIIFISAALFQNGDIKLFDGSQIINDYDDLGGKIRELILSSFRFIYIEAEVDIDNTTDINSKTFEFIKGSRVVNEIALMLEKVKIDDKGKDKKISDLINEKVMNYLDSEIVKKLQEVDKDYDYKNVKTGAISKISEKHISELATEILFNNRELTKKNKGKNISIADMSSGQRRKAFLDFILVMISNLNESDSKKIILAIDEPELSVDAGSRIQQFEKLYKVSESGPGIIFTTHWYGWISQLINGNTILIKESETEREILASGVATFLEKDTQHKVPYEMRMIFDFLSSLGTWAESESSKKFVICEGITDFNYLSKHFPEYKVIPVRGVEEVIRIYKIFSDYYIKVDKKPKNIVFLIDTDPEKNAELKEIQGPNLMRISRNGAGEVKIVNNNENNSEKCSIEDLLSPEPFLKALKDSVLKTTLDIEDQNFIDSLSVKYEDQTGIRAFSLDDIQKQKFKDIYKKEFKKYVSESYNPNDVQKENFKNLLKIF